MQRRKQVWTVPASSAAHANISCTKVRAGNRGARGQASAGCPVQKATRHKVVQLLLSDLPPSVTSIHPPTFLEPHKVLPATGPLLLPFYLLGESAPQIIP